VGVVDDFQRPFFLGIEGGGTRTTALLADARGKEVQRKIFGPGNVRLLNDRALTGLLREIAGRFPTPNAIGLGMAGARTKKDQHRIRAAAAKAWKQIPCGVSHDLDLALIADTRIKQPVMARILVLSGTGSCCFGRGPKGQTAKMGGWGHILGDKGSGFEIGLRALKAVVFYLDRDGTWSRLGERLLAATGCNEPNEWVDWVADQDKATMAALAVEVFAAARCRDRIARDILKGAAASLAKDALHCARKLATTSEPVEFLLAGGVLKNQPGFARKVKEEIRALWPSAIVKIQKREGAWGAVEMAKALESAQIDSLPAITNATPDSPTEACNPRSTNLEKLPLTQAVELMLGEESKAGKTVRAEAKKIARLADWAAQALGKGGRLFYVGAGTSGRLGVLDASECPPTFRSEPWQVQGIIAGGTQALTRAVEGAEDDAEAGGRAVGFCGVGKRDLVVGIAASGRTPFVWGAMKEAARRGARTALVCFNPTVKRRAGVPKMIMAPAVGPEVLTGSTRLKAGTATKLILNCITTLAMVRLGKVAGNLMIDLDPRNEKLRARAIGIVSKLSGVEAAVAQSALEQEGWVIRRALRRLSD
tara:strand:+ start:3800 stop:5578 length:1779 start_codon:yes stop_codon:yes gene_type:complete